MSTKADLEQRVMELETELVRRVSQDELRLFSFIYNAGRPLVVSAPPVDAEELRLLKAALDVLSSVINDRLLQAVAQEAARKAAESPPLASG